MRGAGLAELGLVDKLACALSVSVVGVGGTDESLRVWKKREKLKREKKREESSEKRSRGGMDGKEAGGRRGNVAGGESGKNKQ
ncbi:hypothetical protein Tco_0084219 [Tanacetum coccineum]